MGWQTGASLAQSQRTVAGWQVCCSPGEEFGAEGWPRALAAGLCCVSDGTGHGGRCCKGCLGAFRQRAGPHQARGELGCAEPSFLSSSVSVWGECENCKQTAAVSLWQTLPCSVLDGWQVRGDKQNVVSLHQYFRSGLYKYERRSFWCQLAAQAGSGGALAGLGPCRRWLLASAGPCGEMFLLPTLVHILLKARHWEKMEGWGPTAALWRKTQSQPCIMVFVLLEVQVKNQHVSIPKNEKKISRQIFLSDRLILFSRFLSKYTNFVYKVCYSK